MNINQIPIWVANQQSNEPVTITDEWGNVVETGEIKTIYDEPFKLLITVSPAKGKAVTELFGDAINYEKVIQIAGKALLTEESRIWIDNLVNGELPRDEGGNLIPHDYSVYRIAPSLNYTSVAVNKVKISYSLISSLDTLRIVDAGGNALVDSEGYKLTIAKEVA